MKNRTRYRKLSLPPFPDCVRLGTGIQRDTHGCEITCVYGGVQSGVTHPSFSVLGRHEAIGSGPDVR